MRRRDVLLSMLVALAACSLTALAQTRDQPRRIGVLGGGPRPPDAEFARAPLIGALAELGHGLGRNLVIERRHAEGQPERLPELARELVQSGVEVIVAIGWPAADAARRTTADRPIVIYGVGDPVGVGLVAGLARPGGNVTGLSEASTELSAKRLEMLKEIKPGAARVAVLWNANNPAMTLRYREFEAAAQVMGLAIEPHGLRAAADVEAAIAGMDGRPPDALLLVADAFTRRHRRRVLDFAVEARLPAMYEYGDFVREGGLIAYGPSIAEIAVRAAHYVDRILKGARPADLPMEEPTRFYLSVNLKTARALGIEIPAALLALADEVIE
jgi:putative ABC transport system substrate-binding protein